MRIAFCAALLFASLLPAHCSEVRQVSPDHARTYAYGEVLWRQLYRNGNILAARITFSNAPYSSKGDPRSDEAFDFRFVGASLDPSTGAFYVRASKGKRIVVARLRGGLPYERIALSPGAKIYLLKKSGRVTAVLTATPEARAGLQWIETTDSWLFRPLLFPHWPG
ncbi:MAG: hypothetical protein M3N48_02605 [Verrucomicrobiota bacterium]|nr:hypothetical protein [Verrucomicrobiota bacterium]